MIKAGIGWSQLGQYADDATGAIAAKRSSPRHISCTIIYAPELWPVAKTRLSSMQ
jgi:hypothetical protein